MDDFRLLLIMAVYLSLVVSVPAQQHEGQAGHGPAWSGGGCGTAWAAKNVLLCCSGLEKCRGRG